MALPLIATKYIELVDSLNMMLNNRTLINEFELKRIEKEASSLPEIESRYVVLGMIACLKNDIDGMHRYHKNAIRLSPSNPDVKIQYYVSLRSLELYQEAYDLCFEMYQKNPHDSVAIVELLVMSDKLGNDDNYKKYLSEYENLFNSEELDKPEIKRSLYVYRHRLTDEMDDIKKIVIKSFSSIKSLDWSLKQDPELNTESISIDLVVDSNVDQFFEEYLKYSNELAKKIPLEKMDFIHLNNSFA